MIDFAPKALQIQSYAFSVSLLRVVVPNLGRLLTIQNTISLTVRALHLKEIFVRVNSSL